MKKRALSAIFAAFMAMSTMTACGNDASHRLEDAVANAGQTVSSTPAAQSAPDEDANSTASTDTAASDSDNSDNENFQTFDSSSSVDDIDIDKNLLSVEITIPADQIDSVDDTIAKAEAEGYKVVANEDGSVTYKLTKAQHRQMLNELKKSTDDSINELLSSGNCPSLKRITFNSDYTKASVTVDYDAYSNSLDGFSLLLVGISGSMYQYFNGISSDNVSTEISIIDESTGAIKDTMVYPRDFDDTTNQ